MITTSSLEDSLRSQLRAEGLTDRALDAVWPTWWSEGAATSTSASAELRYTIARRLGIAPNSLFEDRPEFVWRQDAKFKNLGELTGREAAVLASFCVGVGRHLVATSSTQRLDPFPSAAELRRAILGNGGFVELRSLLVVCWSLGVPVVQLKLFPLDQKGLHAVATRSGDRFAILIGRESRFRAQVAFWLAHELGHIALGHVAESSALLDVEDPALKDADAEEQVADAYALELLTGSPDPQIDVSDAQYSAAQLASAVQSQAPAYDIDPAVLALCTAHRDGRWRQAFGALKLLNDEEDVPHRINDLAAGQLDIESLSHDNRKFLASVLGFD